MNALKRITYNCRKATFLIEKKNCGRISIKEELELKYHLMGCSVCRIFQQQSMLINRMVKKQFFNETSTFELDSDFKERLSKRIADEVDASKGI
ncbi:hypothetical protein WG904_11625 [Pedobacter sp. Du54]|uniref:hypothetical protein n=1 Tax=Pedobacter anseongensis TaxID=3133439 RepID=UPI0030B6091A